MIDIPKLSLVERVRFVFRVVFLSTSTFLLAKRQLVEPYNPYNEPKY